MITNRTHAPVDPVIRSDLESGNIRARRWFTGVPTNFTGEIKINNDQYKQFLVWHANVIEYGVLPFLCPVNDGTGVKAHALKFTGMFTATNLKNDLVQVSMPLQMLFSGKEHYYVVIVGENGEWLITEDGIIIVGEENA